MKKVPVWKNLILLISALVVIIIATFAWFYTHPQSSLNDIAVSVGDATFIQISSDNGKTWSEEIDVEFGMNLNIKEISGNGTNFFAPDYDVVELPSGGFGPQIMTFEKVVDSTKYFEQVFELRSDAEHDVYLSPESFVSAVSDQGDNYIDGAIRVAFFEIDEKGNEVLKCVWAPNSNVEYSEATDSFTRDGNVEPFFYYQKSTTPVDTATLVDGASNAHVGVISTEDPQNPGESLICGYNADHKFMWTAGERMPENAPSLLHLKAYDELAGGTKSLKVKVWLEGHDRECVSQLARQKFTMKFMFTVDAVDKGE